MLSRTLKPGEVFEVNGTPMVVLRCSKRHGVELGISDRDNETERMLKQHYLRLAKEQERYENKQN